jgi:pilus assembly protein CpaE
VAGLKSGADEYLVKPIDAAELVARVDGLLERVRRHKAPPAAAAGRVVTFIGAKGGVGTTTTTANVGAALALSGTSALVAELHAQQGSLRSMLGLGPDDGSAGLQALDPAAIRTSNAAGWVIRHASGVQVLAAPGGVLPDRRLEPAQAEAIVSALAGLADLVLVDLPSWWSAASDAVLRMSHVVVLVLDPTKLGLESGAEAATYLRSCARPAADLRLVVVARSPMASPIAARQIQERLGWGFLGSVPPAADECAHAQLLGTLVVQTQPDSTISRAYRDIARQIV